jgi:hypothetical protein
LIEFPAFSSSPNVMLAAGRIIPARRPLVLTTCPHFVISQEVLFELFRSAALGRAYRGETLF